MSRGLSTADFKRAADALGVTPAHIQAIAAVESSGSGFEDGRPVIRFEPHIFRKLTRGRFDKSHPRLSHPYDERRRYTQPSEQADRYRLQFDAAQALDRSAAIQACSWGGFQIMGFNYRLCGFETPQQFLNAHWNDAGRQLDAVVGFIRSMGLADELRREDWAGFAAIYNGPAFDTAPGRYNDYDSKLARAFEAAGG